MFFSAHVFSEEAAVILGVRPIVGREVGLKRKASSYFWPWDRHLSSDSSTARRGTAAAEGLFPTIKQQKDQAPTPAGSEGFQSSSQVRTAVGVRAACVRSARARTISYWDDRPVDAFDPVRTRFHLVQSSL